MFEAPYCSSCGEKEHVNGFGCNNPKCKDYYKIKESLKDSKNKELKRIDESIIRFPYGDGGSKEE